MPPGIARAPGEATTLHCRHPIPAAVAELCRCSVAAFVLAVVSAPRAVFGNRWQIYHAHYLASVYCTQFQCPRRERQK